MNELMLFDFEGNKVDVIVGKNGEPLFEIYSTGMALGHVKIAKGKIYPRKDRIDKNIKNAEISTVVHGALKYIDLNGLRRFITMSNTSNKSKFIDILKDKGYLYKDEVFEYARKEVVLMEHLNKMLQPMGYSLETQKIDDNYRLDAYIPELDLVIEYDENSHSHYDLDKEHVRELYIKNKYRHSLRLTDFDDLMTNLGKIMKKIIEVVQINAQVDTLKN